ncbi:polysaccharide deacetylase family protein [Zhouia amylolytica]|uniref:Polysaccharide deacetylase n=1 Tax=Zhouia amylolytica AD3 TaxID=1286632 RepID=W2UT62_9FLAO|nr:polysaccharide deacetylase family protein [Zhouia amylolytica]ETN96691.1 polysaccharide deacetylase [Zhouia amylolytica AD3]
MYFRGLFVFYLLLTFCQSHAQKSVAITIDDVPNTRAYEKANYQTPLLDQLDSLKIPIAIFINEGLIYKGGATAKNFALLDAWSQRSYITLANHSFSHSRYSEAGFESFSVDVLKGAYITRELSKKYEKSLSYFRFPFNDLGKDSLQHKQIAEFLSSNNYTITPFTIESSDWMFNYIYEYYLDNNQPEKAKAIGLTYVEKTLEYFEFFEELSDTIYNRDIKHIYLCHDNPLNAAYLPQLVKLLKDRGYGFISLDEALTDSVYQQEDTYYKKWGVSWLYRYMPTQEERLPFMRSEPDMKEVISLYEGIQNKSN